jgi:hypothetical protein
MIGPEREAKEGCSFLKKRTKKLFAGASHEAGPSSEIFGAAGISTLECLRRWSGGCLPPRCSLRRGLGKKDEGACEAPGKSFLLLFFQKRSSSVS